MAARTKYPTTQHQRDDQTRPQLSAHGASGRGAETVALATATSALALGIAQAGDEIAQTERIAAERAQREAHTVETANQEAAATAKQVDDTPAATSTAPPLAGNDGIEGEPSEDLAQIAMSATASPASDTHVEAPPHTADGTRSADAPAQVQNAQQGDQTHAEAVPGQGSGRASIEIAESGLADAAEQVTTGFSRVVAGLESGTVATDLAQRIADDIVSGLRDVMAQSGLAQPADIIQPVTTDLGNLTGDILGQVNDQFDASGILDMLQGTRKLFDVDIAEVTEGMIGAADTIADLVEPSELTGDLTAALTEQFGSLDLPEHTGLTGGEGLVAEAVEIFESSPIEDVSPVLGDVVEASASSLSASVLGGTAEGSKGFLSDIFYDDGKGETIDTTSSLAQTEPGDDGVIADVSAAATSITEGIADVPMSLIGQPLSDVEALGGMSNSSNPLHVL